MKKLLFGLLGFTMISLNTFAASPATSNTPKPLAGKKLVAVVGSGSIEKAGMGMTLGLSATKKGADVTIVIGANAIKYALA